jgi:UDP-GlcNAc:undecaprenyl-phosphate GlcNAc-1-phosphate transferase
MSYTASQYILLGIVAFAMSGLLTWPVRKLAIAIGAMDHPNLPRKTQKGSVPYLGGISIALTIWVIVFAAISFQDASTAKYLLASQVLIPATLLGIMGLIDDLRGLEPIPRLMIQTLAALIVSVMLIQTDTMGIAFGNKVIDALISILWIVGICNAINFFDNHDGGAAGTVSLASIGIFMIAFGQEQELVSALSILTAGATLGFLLWNKPPAKIYMGDAGSLFLGVIIATLTIRMNPGVIPKFTSLSIPLMIMAIPILDTSLAVVSRLMSRKSPFTGGSDHLSHRLMRKNVTRRQTVLVLWGLTLLFVLLSYLVYIGSPTTRTAAMVLAGILWFVLFVHFWEPVDLKNIGQTRFRRALFINRNAVKNLRIRGK